MAKNLLGKFQTTSEFSSWAGITRKNHLSMIGQVSPQKASDIMVELMAYKRGRTFEKFLSTIPTKRGIYIFNGKKYVVR